MLFSPGGVGGGFGRADEERKQTQGINIDIGIWTLYLYIAIVFYTITERFLARLLVDWYG